MSDADKFGIAGVFCPSCLTFVVIESSDPFAEGDVTFLRRLCRECTNPEKKPFQPPKGEH